MSDKPTVWEADEELLSLFPPPDLVNCPAGERDIYIVAYTTWIMPAADVNGFGILPDGTMHLFARGGIHAYVPPGPYQDALRRRFAKQEGGTR